MYRFFIKRLFDFVASLTGLLILSPFFIIIFILLFFMNDKNPFFYQKRPGFHGEIFTIIKFKTMNDKKDEYGNLLPNPKRITKVGKFLRKTSLDEIPQLINVLIGDMSIVGPRPLLVSYLALYNKTQLKRHDVKPGITGWAQVNGRNSLSWTAKFKFDVWYVENISFMLDLKIILKTIKKVLKSENINTKSGNFVEPFNGNN